MNQKPNLKKQLILKSLLLIIPFSTFATESYQFELAPRYSSLNISNSPEDADAVIYGLGLTAYLNPVILDNTTPWAITPFYQHQASISVSETREEYTDLSIIRLGRVLKSAEFKTRHVSAMITDATLPVWFGAALTLPADGQFTFSQGPDADIEAKNSQRYDLGWYATQDLGLYGFGEKAEMDGYGAGFNALLRSPNSSFMELRGEYYRSKSDEDRLQIDENTIRNDAPLSTELRSWNLSASLYPSVDFGMTFGYGKTEINDGAKTNVRYLGLNYYATPRINFGLSYQEESQNHGAWAQGFMPLDGFNTRLGFRL